MGFRTFNFHGFSTALRLASVSPAYPVWYSAFQSGSAFSRGIREMVWSYRFAPGRRLEFYGSFNVREDLWPGSGRKFLEQSSKIAQQVRLGLSNGWLLTGTANIVFDDEENGDLPERLTWKIQVDTDPLLDGTFRFKAGLQQQFTGFGSDLVSGLSGDLTGSLVVWKSRIRLMTGFRIFNADVLANPLYAFEPDLLYGWSAPVLSGSGTRWYLNIRCKVLQGLTIEGKIYQSEYSDLKHVTGTGSGGIGGKAQIIWILDSGFK